MKKTSKMIEIEIEQGEDIQELLYRKYVAVSLVQQYHC